jgi:hypothetical protein
LLALLQHLLRALLHADGPSAGNGSTEASSDPFALPLAVYRVQLCKAIHHHLFKAAAKSTHLRSFQTLELITHQTSLQSLWILKDVQTRRNGPMDELFGLIGDEF